MNHLYERYAEQHRQAALLRNASLVLEADSLLSLSKMGSGLRAEQLGAISHLVHSLLTSDEYARMLNELSQDGTLDERRKMNVSVSVRDLIQAKKLPESFVREFQEASSDGQNAYYRARDASDFSIFAPSLERLVELSRKRAEYLGSEGTAYDRLLDQFDPGLNETRLDEVFGMVRSEIVPMVRKYVREPQDGCHSFFLQKHDKSKRERVFRAILDDMGVDRDRSTLTEAPSTYMLDGNPTDVRIYYRDSGSIMDMLGSVVHEGGHSLYELSFSEKELGLPSASPASYTVHESQSRLYENHVGYSREYLERIHKLFKEHYGHSQLSVNPDELYHQAGRIERRIKRVESDELSYHLHVLVRYEIERDLINGKIEVKDLPTIWNAKYREYLGIEIKRDADGILQDVHWSGGSFGYFPTYSLGTFYAAQLFRKIEHDIPGIRNRMRNGDLAPIKTWLNENVHRYGRLYTSEEILEKATGKKLDIGCFIRSMQEKYEEIYGK